MALSISTVLEGTTDRDYSLVGPEAKRAQKNGLVDAEWFRPHVDPTLMGELTERSNARAMIDAVIWIGLIVGFGVAAVMAIGNWWAIPLFIAYGALYGGSSDARWHEFGHSTATRSEPFNNVMYWFSSFLLLRGPTYWRWSHFRHHSDTIVVGRDPEIQIGRAPTIRRFVLNYTNLVNGPRAIALLVRHAAGKIDAEALDFVPSGEVRKMVWESRVIVGVLAASVTLSVATTSFVPVLLVGLPSIYGAWLMVFFGATQHLGLREDVLDHRANCRTIYTNPVFRFLYLNMNYHVEHHMFPSVPYYNLPALHAEIKDALPAPSRGMWDAYKEMVGELWRQRSNPQHELTGRIIPTVEASTGRAASGLARELADGSFDVGPLVTSEIAVLNRVDAGDRTYAVVQLSAEEVCVVDGICTHGQAHLADGVVINGQIECPKHNGRFDLMTGAPCRKPVRTPIQTYDATIVNGRITTTFAARNQDTPPTQAIQKDDQ